MCTACNLPLRTWHLGRVLLFFGMTGIGTDNNMNGCSIFADSWVLHDSLVIPELLPGIDNYLCQVLAKEKLSKAAEKKRQYFLERLDILKLPPSLPPRPDGVYGDKLGPKQLCLRLFNPQEKLCALM